METEILRPKKGLDGVVFDKSAISKVIPEKKHLIYRGYPVTQLAEQCSFEEVAYLLLNDDLPTKSQLAEFEKAERNRRQISKTLMKVLQLFPKNAHPMDTIRTAVSFMGLEDSDVSNNSLSALKEKAMLLYAKIPSLVAADYRIRKNMDPVPPDSALGYSDNFFNMCFDKLPDKEVSKAFDVSMILYAEHGFNASTFTARVVISSLADVYGSVAAAIASLRGTLHGGANEAVMRMLLDIDGPENAKAWLEDMLVNKRKIMGFGHRLYRIGDSRVPTMKKYRDLMAQVTGHEKLVEVSNLLEKEMIAKKNIYPNLDYPAGPAYYMMGFDIDLFTPLFVMSRVTGWTAHIIEQMSDNRLVRPMSDYVGPDERLVKSLDSR